MKRVWQLIEKEMRSEGLTAKQMAHRLKMDPAHLSRLRTGQLRDLSPETLGSLVTGLRKSPALHSDLLAAYLTDKLEGNPTVHLESVTQAVSDLHVCEAPAPYGAHAPETIAEACMRSGLNLRVSGALATLAGQARTDRKLQTLLISLAEYTSED